MLGSELRTEENRKDGSIRYTSEKRNCQILEFLVLPSLTNSGNMDLVPLL